MEIRSLFDLIFYNMSIFRDGEELSVFESSEAAVDMLCRVMELP